MSSSPSSSYKPDDSDDSDYSEIDSTSNRRKRNQQRSVSRAQDLGLGSLNVVDLTEPQPQPQPEEQDDDEPFSSQSRWERADAHLRTVKPRNLAQYTRLLEEFQTHTESGNVGDNNVPYPSTQNGAVTWTSAEKEILYSVLEIKGRNGIRQIAAMIKTKSELEVMDYLRLLQRGVKGQHSLGKTIQPFTIGDIPSSIEVGKECCSELDKYAQAMVIKEDLDLELEARAKYLENGLISDAQAKALVTEETNPPLEGSIHLAANLLNVPMWTRLPAVFFMNFGGPRAEDSWHNIVQSRRETPSIYGDALMDFYAITMSITRRLVQSVIFFATARLRSMSRINRVRKQAVRKRDVKAALEVLKMKPNRAGFFVGAARRNHLEIVNDLKNEEEPRPVSYDDAEQALRHKRLYESDTDGEYTQSEVDDEADKSMLKTAKSQSNSTPVPVYKTPSVYKSPWNKIPLEPDEEVAEIIDLERSRREEVQLWRLMGARGPSHINTPLFKEGALEQRQLVRKPRIERRLNDDMLEWRDCTLYRSDWEEYGSGMRKLEKELNSNRRKRRWSIYEEETQPDIERPRRLFKKQRKLLSAETIVDSSSSSSDEEEMEMPDEKGGTKDTNQDPIQLDDRDDLPKKKRKFLSAETVVDSSSDEQELETPGGNGGTEDTVQAPIQLNDDDDDDDRMDVDEAPNASPSVIELSDT